MGHLQAQAFFHIYLYLLPKGRKSSTLATGFPDSILVRYVAPKHVNKGRELALSHSKVLAKSLLFAIQWNPALEDFNDPTTRRSFALISR